MHDIQGWKIEIRFPEETENFLVSTTFRAHTTSPPVRIRGLFQDDKFAKDWCWPLVTIYYWD